MKISYLGSGAWGLVLASLAADNGHDVQIWSIENAILDSIAAGKGHPKFPTYRLSPRLRIEKNLSSVIASADVIVESVTSKGVRPVLAQMRAMGEIECPIILTSKGIEQGSGLLLSEIALEVLGEEYRQQIGYFSGPTLADEVMEHHPTSAIAASFSPDVASLVKEIFSTPYFSIDTSDDINGVALGGAVKNVMAIAAGIADGKGYGYNTKSAIIVRGLEEMQTLAHCKNARLSTLQGLAGLGDLCVTCSSPSSRNYRFGYLIGSGMTPEKAQESIGMVVEGTNTVSSLRELADKYDLQLPITDIVYSVIFSGADFCLPISSPSDILEV